MYGQEAENGQPLKKSTGWMSNSQRILNSLALRCGGRNGACSRGAGGRHGVAMERDATLSAIYPFDLCRAILEGARQQLRDDDRLTTGVYCIMPRPDAHLTDVQLERRVKRLMHITDGYDDAEAMATTVTGAGQYRDAITGQPLDPDMVRAARRKELEYFNSKHVWDVRDRAEALRRQGKPPISVRWIDVNKGDDSDPNYRSRLVAREIRRAGEDPIFAPAPPLESIRTVLSLAATQLPSEPAHDRRPESEMRTQRSWTLPGPTSARRPTRRIQPMWSSRPSTRTMRSGSAACS